MTSDLHKYLGNFNAGLYFVIYSNDGSIQYMSDE
jgi:hypothetical protein